MDQHECRRFASASPRLENQTLLLDRFLASISNGEDARSEQTALSLALLPASQHEQAIRGLGELLKSTEEDWRWWAIRALSEIPNERIPLILCAALADPSPAVRQCAALGIRFRPDPQTIPGLIQALQDPDPLTARLAADALSVVGELAVQPLLEILENASPLVRLLAVRTLAEIKDPRAIQALFTALDDESMLVEYWANEGLERMGVGMAFFNP